MRIIAGEFRGRTLLGPRDASTTRPITGRVRTSVFDRLTVRGLLDDEPVLDVFAGTGTLGIEALSRGASVGLFVEKDREALRRLERNIASLDVADRCVVRAVDALHSGWVEHVPEPFTRAAVAFVDPPYALWRDAARREPVERLMSELASCVVDDGVMVLRAPTAVDAPRVSGWDEPETFTFGSQRVHWYARHGR